MASKSPATRRLALSCLLFGAVGSPASAQQDAQFLDAPMIVVPDHQQRMNAVLDLDGDGWSDAIGTFWPMSNKAGVYGFHNDGTGRLAPLFKDEWNASGSNDLPFPVAVGDLDHDGLDDFAVASRGILRVYGSKGAAQPELLAHIDHGTSYLIQDVTIGDYDGNGRMDVAIRAKTASGGDAGIRVYDKVLNGQTGSYTVLVVPADTGVQMENADANGDGVTDLALIGPQRVDFAGYQAGSLTLLGAGFAHGILDAGGACGDVDGDGDEDVVIFGMSGSYRILRRTGPTSFALEAALVGGPATNLADVDGDGDLDGVCCGGGGGGPSTYSNGKASWFEIAKNDGSGGFAPSFKIPSYGANHIAGVVDLDHDGDADLVAGRVVYYNVHGIDPVLVTHIPLYSNVFGDFDGDGDPDTLETSATFMRNRGDGVLESIPRVSPNPPVGSVFVGPGYSGDFDGDGDLDLIVHEVDASGTRERLLRNNGGGGLTDGGAVTAYGVTFSASAKPDQILVGDVDGDGDADVIGRRAYGNDPLETRVYLQDAAGQFALAVTITDEFPAAVADIDGDGKVDIVTLGPADARIRFGDALGAMTTSVSLTGAPASNNSFPPGAAIADMDEDGDLDVVVPNATATSYNFTVRVAENLGGRSFTPHDVAAGYVGAMLPLLVDDVNHDGAADLLLGQRREDTSSSPQSAISVCLGSPTPGVDVVWVGDQYPLIWGLADLDGDGDKDGLSGFDNYFAHAVQSPQESYRVQYGEATPGSGGQKPNFGAVGPFQGGAPIELRITGAAPNAAGLLLVGFANGSAQLGGTGGFLNVLPLIVVQPVFFPSASGDPGSGGLVLPLTVPSAAVGYHFFHQVVIADPGAQGGASLSNGLQLYYGK